MNTSGSCDSALNEKCRVAPGDWIVGLCLIAFNFCFFFRTVFQGKAISKLCRLANWDSVYQQYTNSSTGSCDPSLVQLLLPNYFLVARLWHQFTLPLWNSWSGCGTPLVGDIQASVFAPVRIALALFPNAHTYNLILVGEVILCSLGTFLLARLLRFDRGPAAFVALTFSYCPYNLYYLELLSGTSQALLPLLLASFVYLAQRNSAAAITFCSFACAIFVLSGHPESSLYGVISGIAIYLAVAWWILDSGKRVSLYAVSFKVALVGVLSFALAAPALLPFIEYLACGDSYKYGDGQAAFAPWQGLILNLLQPCYGPASPFLGIVAVILLPLSLCCLRKFRSTVIVLLGLATLSLLLISRVGIIDNLLAIRPFSYLITVYLIPIFLLIIALLAGLGLQSLACVYRQWYVCTKPALFVALVATLLPLASFYLNVSLHDFNFDQTLPDMHFELSCIFFNSILLLLFLAPVYCWLRYSRNSKTFRALPKICMNLAIFFNLVSLVLVSKNSLAVQPAFDFPKTNLTNFFQAHSGRVLSVIEHVLKPNTNIVYGISALRVHNPLLPARFCEFAELCGARLDEFHNQSYDQVTPVIDLASIKYVVSQFKPVPERYKLLETTAEGVSIYLNPAALPEVYLASSVITVANKAAAKAIVQSKEFDPHSQVVAEIDSIANICGQQPGARKILPLELQRIDCNHSYVSYTSAEPAFLVFTDTFYPGWRATIDGVECPIERANFLFRGLSVPAGQHQVRFFYEPLSFSAGVILAIGAFLLIALMTFRSILIAKTKMVLK